MENKKSTGKTVAIVILIILLLRALGYTAYDKVIIKETEEPEKTEKKVETTKEEVSTTITFLEGYYKTGQTYSTEEKPCDLENNSLHGETTEILFNSDGTYTSAYAADCGGGYQWTGTYKVNNSDLILTCDNNDGPCTDGKYMINEYGTIIDKNNNLYAKVDKTKMQILTD